MHCSDSLCVSCSVLVGPRCSIGETTMYKIIIVHLVMFAALFGLALPALETTLAGSVAFNGGLLSVAVLTLLSEVVVIGNGVLSRVVTIKLGVNPLLQRNKGEAIAMALLTLVYGGFLLVVSALVPSVLSVTWPAAFILGAIVTAALFAALHIKRAIIRAQP